MRIKGYDKSYNKNQIYNILIVEPNSFQINKGVKGHVESMYGKKSDPYRFFLSWCKPLVFMRHQAQPTTMLELSRPTHGVNFSQYNFFSIPNTRNRNHFT